jgi:hypothetical protein
VAESSRGRRATNNAAREFQRLIEDRVITHRAPTLHGEASSSRQISVCVWQTSTCVGDLQEEAKSRAKLVDGEPVDPVGSDLVGDGQVG